MVAQQKIMLLQQRLIAELVAVVTAAVMQKY
jgi:hypothetical protein